MLAIRRIASQVLKNNVRTKHTLPELPYPYEALEPVISRDIMCLHHTKHHATYVNNLNATEEKLKQALEKNDPSAAIATFSAINFNGGGHINHTIFWDNLTPHSTTPSKELCAAISASFGSMDNFRQEITNRTVAIQGSGWGWLGFDPKTNCLKVATLANQDPLVAHTGLLPLFGIDVWEHAYYLQYKNVRADYVKAIWDIINWEYVSKKYKEYHGKSC